MRLGSTGEPFRWYISQPPNRGPLTSHFWRLTSDDRMNAPFLVPTRTRTPLIRFPFLSFQRCFLSFVGSAPQSELSLLSGDRSFWVWQQPQAFDESKVSLILGDKR